MQFIAINRLKANFLSLGERIEVRGQTFIRPDNLENCNTPHPGPGKSVPDIFNRLPPCSRLSGGEGMVSLMCVSNWHAA
jgi:hypothetical protein